MGTDRAQTHEGFLLSRQWRDTSSGLELSLWVRTPQEVLHITITGQKCVLFVVRATPAESDSRRQVALTTMNNVPVDALYFRTQRQLFAERARLVATGAQVFEADVKPVERFLMERFILGGVRVIGPGVARGGVVHLLNPQLTSCEVIPQLVVLSIDIETRGLDGPLLSIAGATDSQQRVFLIAPTPGAAAPKAETLAAHVSWHADVRSGLDAFLRWVEEVDPDLIIGWNLIEFDLRFLADLCKKLGRRFELGRARGHAEVLAPRHDGQPFVARVPGRVVLDGIATLRSATYHFESFALDDVAHQLLGRRKAINKTADPVAEIVRMAECDPPALAAYNLEDCRLVLDIFVAAKLVEFAVERQRLTGLAMDRQGGSVAAFDQLYLPRLHRAGFVAPSLGASAFTERSPGGYVMESVPGLYRNVLVLDFKSLYPSIIRTFLIDPLGLAQAEASNNAELSVPGFEGAHFAREGHILPELIRKLWAARDQAKADKNKALSQAIKIIMNSFYGVLGTPGCRFFDQRLVSSITLRGHDIIQRSQAFIQEQGLKVIYGDTDSLFVSLSEELDISQCADVGQGLARDLTAHFRALLADTLQIESHLELEFETHFTRFLMPTLRGSDRGTKKRYAGTIVDTNGQSSLIFKGLESVRSDWTQAAREFQRELFRRVFADEPYVDFVRQTAQAVRSGAIDSQLVYRKRLRRKLSEYTRNVPPHVQAARMLKTPGRKIAYVITTRGPQPTQHITAPLDYNHYIESQLAPAADSILQCLGTSFDTLAGRQLGLFG